MFSNSTYEMEPRNRFLEAVSSIVDAEIHPGRTVTFLHEVDLGEVEQVRRRAVEDGELKPSYTAFVVKAVALALRAFPYANRRIVWRPWGLRVQRFQRCDIAVACERDLPEAPMAAFLDVLRAADQLSLAEITTWLRELATCDLETNAQWRAFHTVNTRLPRWLASLLHRLTCLSPNAWVRWRGGAVMISSPAKYGVDAVATTWSAPLGVSFGLAKERPVVRNGAIVARPTFMLTLNFDRRVMAGAQGARFFKRIIDILENAETDLASNVAAQHGYAVVPAAGQDQRLAPAAAV